MRQKKKCQREIASHEQPRLYQCPENTPQSLKVSDAHLEMPRNIGNLLTYIPWEQNHEKKQLNKICHFL